MLQSTTTQTVDPFQVFRQQVSQCFAQQRPSAVFTTDTSPLYETFLQGLSPDARPTYQCHACRAFVNRYGSLVTLDEHGASTPLLWPLPDIVPDLFSTAVHHVYHRVLDAKVTGVFLSPLATWGMPESPPTLQGHVWTHLYAHVPDALRHPQGKLTAGQAMAEKREDHRLLGEAIGKYPRALAQQAVAFLQTEQFYRAEKVLGVAQWFLALHETLAGTQHRRRRAALLWRAVASTPPGWCHIGTTMVGTLLDDMASGLPFAACTRKFADKMHPLRYQRPQALPTEGAVDRAEKLVAQMGIAQSLERRYATMADIQEFVWRPSDTIRPSAIGGIFTQLRTRAAPIVETGRQIVTWRKFAEEVLPMVVSMECYIPTKAWSYVALTTATHADAPPILQWDRPEHRNPVAWYFYQGGRTPACFNLQAAVWQPVIGIICHPCAWGQERQLRHFSEGCFFLLKNARDLSSGQGLGLFPETLCAEYREIRAVIEAHSRTQTLTVPEDVPVCGVGFAKGQSWGIELFVITSNRLKTIYIIDRWD